MKKKRETTSYGCKSHESFLSPFNNATCLEEPPLSGSEVESFTVTISEKDKVSSFLNQLFKSYYLESSREIGGVESLPNREIAFVLWSSNYWNRPYSFNNIADFRDFLIRRAPRHLFYSAALYERPDIKDMYQKKWYGCDFIVDIDADHFDTPCQEEHNFWYCSSCGFLTHEPMISCSSCESDAKLKYFSWICETCLEHSKREIVKLVDDFLVPDFGIDEDQFTFTYSGNRGYHLKVLDKEMRTLSSSARRDIVDYLTGKNISFQILGLKNDKYGNVLGISKKDGGWSSKIIDQLLYFLSKKNIELEYLLRNSIFGLNTSQIDSLINYKDYLVEILVKDREMWGLEGFGIETWKSLLEGIVKSIAVHIDVAVSYDVRRVIRYPLSLHGKTGFKVLPLQLEELDVIKPLNESNPSIDPILFQGERNNFITLTPTVPKIPLFRFKGDTYGPFYGGNDEKIDVPLSVGVLLLCKEVATLE